MAWRSDSKRKGSAGVVTKKVELAQPPLRLRLKGLNSHQSSSPVSGRRQPLQQQDGWQHFLHSQKQAVDSRQQIQDVSRRLLQVERQLTVLPRERRCLRRQKQLRHTAELLRRELRSLYAEEKAMDIDSRIRPYAREQCALEQDPVKDPQQKLTLLEECVRLVFDHAPSVNVVNEEVCKDCNLPMRYDTQQAFMMCDQCGNSVKHIDVTASSTQYGDEVEFSTFLYKRTTHFTALLQQSQAKSSTTAPMFLMNKIMEQLLKERFGEDDLHRITRDKIRNIIRDLKLENKYYALSTQIACTLTGIPPPRMTPEQEQRLNIMFASIQLPFERHCPPDRKNFFSYNFCMYKCCELLGYTEFLPLYSLLKGRKKLDKQDEMWKKICEDLDWEYKRSVPQKG